jgi:urease accessory protein
MKTKLRLLAAIVALSPTAAWAHPGHEGAGGMLAGIVHPLTGIDHLVAMLLVGLWAGLLAKELRGALMVPPAFLAAMLTGFVATAFVGGAFAEPMILASLIVLGAAAALHFRARVPVATAIAAVFGFAHGMAHGFETPEGSFPALFAAGFLLSTAALHAAGLWLARVLPVSAMRLIGAGGAVLGLAMAGTA